MYTSTVYLWQSGQRKSKYYGIMMELAGMQAIARIGTVNEIAMSNWLQEKENVYTYQMEKCVHNNDVPTLLCI